MAKRLSSFWNKSLPLLGFGSATIGFGADILQPFAPLTSYIFFASAFVSAAILLTMIVKSSLRASLTKSFIFTLSMMVCSGGLYVFHDEENIDTGIMATVFPIIKNLQSNLGLIEQDLVEIRKLTEKNTEETKKIAEVVQKSTTQIIGSLAEIQQGFSEISKSGGVIANPTRPEQFYHNARVREQGGDYLNARESYNRFFSFKLDFIDPHLRYQTFLKIQEGRAGAREIYSEIYESDPRPIIEFARILLFDAPKRTEMLKKFIDKNPNFVPAYYELSREYSEARKGVQSLTDKLAELKALKDFVALRNQGKFLRFFVDKGLASKWIEDVEERLKLLSLVEETSAKSPISMTASVSGGSWTVNFSFSEKVREIYYKLEGEDDFNSTGLMDYIDPATGLPMPWPIAYLPSSIENTIISVKYIDINKNERGPFELSFVGRDLLASHSKKIAEMGKFNWLGFSKNGGDLNVYFSTLLSNKCGLSEIRYGVDKEVPEQVFELGVCVMSCPSCSSITEKTYLKIPLNTKFVTAQVTYTDGSTSDVQKFINNIETTANDPVETTVKNLVESTPHNPGELPNCEGSWSSSRWRDCFGTYVWNDGSEYVGEFKDGKRHGQGKLIFGKNTEWAGDQYIGEYKDNNPNGEGTYTWADGRKHVGEYKDGDKHGQGIYTWPDGRKYVGMFKDNKKHGRGTYTYENGEKYKGTWENGRLNGYGIIYSTEGGINKEGIFKNDEFLYAHKTNEVNEFYGQSTYTYPDGEKYVGEYWGSKRHGQGTTNFANGDKYIGEYKDDERHGQGTYIFVDGERYVGDWQNDNRTGQGTYYYLADNEFKGDKYIGDFKDNKRHGQGTYSYASGSKYVGDWKDNKTHGQGSTTFANGDKYVGEYKYGKMHGEGTYTYSDGSKEIGAWENNRLNGYATTYYADGSINQEGTFRNDVLLE